MSGQPTARVAGAARHAVLSVLQDGRKCVAVGKNYLKHITEMQHTHGSRSAEVSLFPFSEEH